MASLFWQRRVVQRLPGPAIPLQPLHGSVIDFGQPRDVHVVAQVRQLDLGRDGVLSDPQDELFVYSYANDTTSDRI
jgi:hypothetical protein